MPVTTRSHLWLDAGAGRLSQSRLMGLVAG
jgi:hypothetical protein